MHSLIACHIPVKIPSNKASGLDNISARLLKEASPIVTRSLTFIINQSITIPLEYFQMLGNELEFRQYLKNTPGLILTTTDLSQFCL